MEINSSLKYFNFLSDLHVVGGSVRDEIIGRDSDDIDLATSDHPHEVIRKCESKGLNVVKTGIDHGTVTAFVNEVPVEITTFRFDVSTDGRRATVKFADRIEDDLARRDFTINAIALNKEGIVDPFNGRRDIERGVVKTVGVPEKRFKEDFLRIIRACRFAGRFGFDIGSNTKEAMHQFASEVMNNVSVERVIMELEKAFKDPTPSRFIKFIDDMGLKKELHNDNVDLQLIDDLPKNLRIEGFFLNVDDMEKVSERLKLPNDLRDRVIKFQKLGSFLEEKNPSKENIRRFHFKAGDYLKKSEILFNLLMDNVSPFFSDVEMDIDPILMGRDLIEAGYDPGPKFGEALDTAHDFQLEHGVSDKQKLMEVAKRELS